MRSAAGGQEGDALRIVTANMWGIPWFSRDIDARFDALAERLRDDPADVVALQEMWADAPRRRLLEELRGAFPFQADFQSQYGRGGLVVLSRHPFVETPRFVPFTARGKWWKPWTGEWWGGKGIGALHLQLPRSQIWFFNTHLHACYERSEGACDGKDEYASHRWEQLRALRATVGALAGTEPALIVGDFNFTGRSEYFDFLGGPVPGESGSVPDPAWHRIEEPGGPANRIDHLFVRPGRDRSPRVIEPARVTFAQPVETSDGTMVPLSDHCAIGATVTMNGVGSPAVPARQAARGQGRA